MYMTGAPFFSILLVPDESAESSDEAAAKADEKKEILCGTCGMGVTSPGYITSRQGGTEHTFTNAYGYVFRVCCFKKAEGCIAAGIPTEEFTWFNGYIWEFALCKNCHQHLGWFYRSADDSFFGLIRDSLIFPD